SAESTALETAGGIANALPLLGSSPFLVINGDIWCDWDVSGAKGLGHQLELTGKHAWLLLVDNPAHHPGGDFYLDESGLVHASANRCTNRINRLTFAGIGIYRPELFLSTPPGLPAPLAPLLREAMSRHQ